MTLQSSGSISMSEIRSEIGTSGAISMSDLYRVNTSSEFPTTKEITDAISSVSDSGYGQSGYSERYNVGNLNTSNAGTGYYGGVFPYQYGYLINNQGASSNIINSGASGIFSGGALSFTADNIMYMGASGRSGQAVITYEHDITFARAGTYYVWGYSLGYGATIAISGANSGNISATSMTNAGYRLDSTIGVSANQTVSIDITSGGERIFFGFSISTSNSTSLDKTITVNSGVPSSGTISFSDLYGAEG